MKADSTRTIYYALGANLAIAVAKTGAAVFTGSSAMLAEAIHSYADAGNQGLLLWGMKQAKRPPSPEYPLGWGKAVFFWSFIVALVLFSLGGLFSLYEGWHKSAFRGGPQLPVGRGRHPGFRHRGGVDLAARLPARSEQGRERPHAVALVPRRAGRASWW